MIVESAIRCCMTQWLPRCLTCRKPFDSRILTTSAPESTRSLPNPYLDLGNENFSVAAAGDFFLACRFEEERKRLDEIRAGLLDARTLTRNVKLWAECDEPIVLALDESRQFLDVAFHF